MKTLLFVLLFGIAAAQAVPDEHLVISETLIAVQRSLEGPGRLWVAVDLPEYAEELKEVEMHMKTKFGEWLKDALDDLVGGIKKRVTQVKDVSIKVTEKVKELKEKLRELGDDAKSKSNDAIEAVKNKVIDIVKTLEESIKKQTSNLDEDLDEASKLKVKDLIQVIRNRITRKVKDIRDYVEKLALDNKLAQELKKLLDKMSDDKLSEILDKFTDLSGHELRHIKELHRQLIELGKESTGVLKDKIYDLVHYLRNFWQSGVGEVADRFTKVKATLIEIIGNTKDFSVGAAKEALRHLESYKEHLGDLYHDLIKSLKKSIGRF